MLNQAGKTPVAKPYSGFREDLIFYKFKMISWRFAILLQHNIFNVAL